MLICSLVVAAMLCGQDPDALSPQMAALQGTWEATLERGGKQVRVVKKIEGYRETVRALDDNGKVAYEHIVDVSLEESEGVHIFRWTNGQITLGARQGQKLADGVCVYRLRQDEWTAVYGLTDREQGPVYREIFKRRR